MEITVLMAERRFKEIPGFVVNKAEGVKCFFFYHFLSSVEKISTENGLMPLRPGGCILYPEGQKQYIWGGNVRLSYDYLSFKTKDPAFFKTIGLPMNQIFYPENNSGISHKIEEMSSLGQNSYFEKDVLLSNAATSFFIFLAQELERMPSANKEKLCASLIAERKRLCEHPEETKMKDIAKRLNLSPVQLTRLWRKNFAITPKADLNKARQKRLSKETRTSGEVSAKSLGFKNRNYFYRWSKKQNLKT